MRPGGGGIPFAALLAALLARGGLAQDRVKVAAGMLEGIRDEAAGVLSFKGVPFAAPPVGELRWRPPQPPRPWKGIRKADAFGAQAMQRRIFDDMVFRASGIAEDCLYLNVWTPAKSRKEKLPVLVYFYGGGFVAGDGSEPRYDGAAMARKGIVSVTVNYRLGVFGFFSHPELTRESPHGASGNYGLLDQRAALVWVKENIAAFGGDPERVTIAGESAGSMSVSAQMASPLSRDLIAGAIGESGSAVGGRSGFSLVNSEKEGVKFAARLGLGDSPSLEQLRALPAEELVEASGKPGVAWFRPNVDGYFLPRPAVEIYAAGEQARVPLLAGSNSAEGAWNWLMGGEKPTVEGYRKVLGRLYGDAADEVFAAYPASSEEEVLAAATDLSSDRFISHATWKWMDLATRTGGKPTYYYLYSRPRPAPRGAGDEAKAPRGAAHSAEIEYALGNLDLNEVFAWTEDDRKVSRVMQGYFVNFIRTGDPNGPGLPAWPKYSTGRRLVIDVETRAEPDRMRPRYELLSRLEGGK